MAGDATAFERVGVEVVVDFTHLDAARQNLAWAAEHGIHAVVGTTGFTADDYRALRSRFTRSNCVIAPNFAIGAVLMMRFAELAAPYFETAEIIELHHDAKVDAPSGTAMLTAERMAAASDEWAPDPTADRGPRVARGGKGPAGIRVHSVRMRGMVAHQEVAARHHRPDAHHPARLLRPGVVHARRAAGRQGRRRPPRRHRRPRRGARSLSTPA